MAFFDEYDGGLITHWKSVSAITDLIGTGDNARAWPDVAPQGQSVPYIVFTLNGRQRFNDLADSSTARLAVVHVYSYGSSRSAADALSEAVRANTKGMRGTYTSTIVLQVFANEEPDYGFDQSRDRGQTSKYWTRQIYRIVYAE